MSMLLRRYHGKDEAEVLDRPAASAKKADWAAYAVQEGHDVEGLNKDDIVALFAEPADEVPAAEEEAPEAEVPAAESDTE